MNDHLYGSQNVIIGLIFDKIKQILLFLSTKLVMNRLCVSESGLLILFGFEMDLVMWVCLLLEHEYKNKIGIY